MLLSDVHTLGTDLIVSLLLSAWTLGLLLTLPDGRAYPARGQRVTGRPSVPAGPLEPLQEPHQQQVGGQLLHRPAGHRSSALGAEQLGVGRLLSLQAGGAESVLAGQDLGRGVQLLVAQGTLQQGHQGQLLHPVAASLWEQGFRCTVVHHTGSMGEEAEAGADQTHHRRYNTD